MSAAAPELLGRSPAHSSSGGGERGEMLRFTVAAAACSDSRRDDGPLVEEVEGRRAGASLSTEMPTALASAAAPKGAAVKPAPSIAVMSAESGTGPRTVALALSRSTVASSTPGMARSTRVTLALQWPHDMPPTRKRASCGSCAGVAEKPEAFTASIRACMLAVPMTVAAPFSCDTFASSTPGTASSVRVTLALQWPHDMPSTAKCTVGIFTAYGGPNVESGSARASDSRDARAQRGSGLLTITWINPVATPRAPCTTIRVRRP